MYSIEKYCFCLNYQKLKDSKSLTMTVLRICLICAIDGSLPVVFA